MTAAINLDQLARICAGRMLNSVIEGIAIGLFAWILLRIVGRRNSSTRFAVWFSALLAIAMLPVLGSGNSALTTRSSPAFTVASSWALGYLSLGDGRQPSHWRGWPLVCGNYDTYARVALRSILTTLDPVLRSTLHGFQVVRSVQLCQSDRVQVPTAIGFLNPAVVIPAWTMQELSTAELNSILIHELAHLRRWDDWTNLAQQILKALLFFHPAVWWIENKLALEREMACDDAVLAETSNPRDYAQCLVSMAERSFLRRGLAMAQAVVNRVRQTSLRISQILDVNRSSATRVWKPALYSVAAFSAVCLASLSHAPQLVAFEDRTPEVTVASATPENEMLPPAASSNYIAKQPVATPLIFHVTPREGTSSLVPQKAENKSGFQPVRRGISVQPNLSAANARRTNAKQDSAEPTEAKLTKPSLDDLMLAETAPFIENVAPPQTVLVVMQSEYRQAGPMLWRLYVWQVVVFDSSQIPAETRLPAKRI